MPEIYEILYCSMLTPAQPVDTVGRIVAQARVRNAAHGITGLLVFDGIRFCQHLEGPREKVLWLASVILQDPRHCEVHVAYEGTLPARRYQRFDLGFAQSEEPDDMAGVHALEGRAALDRFLLLRPEFDISG